MIYETLGAFYEAHPRRRGSPEHDFGVNWRALDRHPVHRLSSVEATGELYGLRLTSGWWATERLAVDARPGPVEVLAEIPTSGHPDNSKAHLIVEAVLFGWPERCGSIGSLGWARERAWAGASESLSPIDWSECCVGLRCVLQRGVRTRLDAPLQGRCPDCGAPLLLADHPYTAGELEARLRADEWWHACARGGR